MLSPLRIAPATDMRCTEPPIDAVMSTVARMDGHYKQSSVQSRAHSCIIGALGETVQPDATIGDLKGYAFPSENRHGD